MHLDGRFTVSGTQSEVYAFLTDPQTVSRHMPDVKHVVIEDADHFTVTARVGVSHIKGDVLMKLTITDRQPPISTTVVGKGTGLASALDMVTNFTLESSPGPQGPGLHPSEETTVHWRADVTISGKLAAFGPPGLMDRIARKNIDTFIEGIRKGLLQEGASGATR